MVGSAHAADGGEARRYVPCRNQLASPSRYLVHRDDLLAVLAEIDRTGEELWGVVHSHVRTPAVPSRSDVGEAAWPAAVYLLVSLANDADGRTGPGVGTGPDGGGAGGVGGVAEAPGVASLRAWRIADGEARELALRIVADPP